MKLSARKNLLSAAKVTLTLAVVLASPALAKASAGSPQVCQPSTTCKVGEFLYDDSYVPVTSATCTITARYPDGSLFLNSEAMTVSADGWYEKSFSTPTVTGMYRAQVCCTIGSEYLCIDKSFESKDAGAAASVDTSAIASAVWDYSDRSLTGFGSLVSDIWGNAGTLVRDIWIHGERTLTKSSSSSSNTSDLSEIEKVVKENRIMLEKLVNKPIIENTLEEEVPNLQSMLGVSKQTLTNLKLDTDVVVSKMGLLMLSWDTLTGDEVATGLKEVGDKATAIASGAESIGKTWKWEEAAAVNAQAVLLSDTTGKTVRSLRGSGGFTAAYKEGKQALVAAEALEKLVNGQLSEKLVKTENLAMEFDKNQADLEKLLQNDQDINAKVGELAVNVEKLNQVPNAVLASQPRTRSGETAMKKIRNRVFSLLGLLDLNRRYMAMGGEGVVRGTWLEEGSMVFKTVVTNPSKLISQEVEIKYYLPPELKNEDILETDEGLTVKQDVERGQYYVEGKYLLKANESKTLEVRADDIWTVTDTEIATFRNQSKELAKPLEKTAFYAQGVTLQSDVDVALDKVSVLIKSAVTPEQKIRAWREAQIELGGVKIKIEKQKDLLAQASASKGFLGFVGGAQVMAVWGLVVIFLAGFVFLAVYMRLLARGEKKEVETKTHHTGGKWKLAFVIVLSTVMSSGASGLVVYKLTEVQPIKAQVETAKPEVLGVGGPDLVMILVKDGTRVNLRETADNNAEVVFKYAKPAIVERMEENENWVKVLDDKGRTGWVMKEFILEGQSEEK